MVAVPLLSGCGSSGDDDQCTVQYSTSSVQVGASGLMLEPSSNMHVTFPQIEQFYREAEACVGVIATGPTVSFENFNGPMGVMSVGVGLIRINTNPTWERDCKTDEFILRHEYVHHLLHAAGVSIEDNVSHNSPFFGQCA